MVFRAQEVPRICKVLDEEVRGFLAGPTETECPYIWLDATFHMVREVGRVISVATVVAVGVTKPPGSARFLVRRPDRARTTSSGWLSCARW